MAEENKVELTEEVQENVMEAVVHADDADVVSVKKLLEAGVHYGHQTRRWNPKMGKYIYTAKNGIYIIDLTKTKAALEEAYKKLEQIVLENGKVLIVGTKDNVKETVQEEAERSGSFYVTNRWLGGILTNFKTIQPRIKKLKDLEAAEADGSWDRLSKKEAIALGKEKDKLAKNLEGIKEMRKLPNAVIVVDPMQEHNAIAEAKKLGIPVFAFCDTNADPDGIDYVIPGNDDSTKSVKLLLGVLNDAVVEAKGGLAEVAFAKEEGDDATMRDVLKQVERENALRLAARKEMQKERQERERARRESFLAKQNAAQKEASVAPKAEEAKEEVKEEAAAE